MKNLESMTIQELKDLYSGINNPSPVIGTGKNGCKLKKDWIEAVQKSFVPTTPKETTAPLPEEQPEEEIPFTDWEEIPEEELLPDYETGYRALPKQESIGLPISFGWTCDRLLAGMKTVTRRTWSDKYAQIFINAYHQNKLVPAFDKDRRYGGKLIGYLKLTCEPYKESLFEMTKEDVNAEGYPELTWTEFVDKYFPGLANGQMIDDSVFVIRFEFYPLETPQETPPKSELKQRFNALEKYNFLLMGGKEEAENCFHWRNPDLIVNGWSIYLSADHRTKHPRIRSVSIVNYQLDEFWRVFVNYPLMRASYKKCLAIAKKAILEMSFDLSDSLVAKE